MLARVVSVVLVALLVFPFATETHPAEAKKRFRTKNVTRTFSNTGQIQIRDDNTANPYPVPIQVGGFKKGKIKDVDVTLRDFSHDRPDHVDILLVAPGGRNTLLMSDAGGNDPIDNITLRLDDQATASLPLTSQIVTGSFRPTNDNQIDNLPAPAPLTGQTVALSVFSGINPNGTWQLFIRDDANMINGDIAGGWELEITAKVKKKKKRR
jgi:subtilisin-like proprotein convertase family protein